MGGPGDDEIHLTAFRITIDLWNPATVALAEEPIAERREFPISVLHHPRERIGIAAPPAANQIVPTEIGPAEIDEVNQEQRFAFAFGKVNKRRHVFLDRFQAFDRFVRRRRFILEIALYAQIEILFRRRLEHRRDQPRTIRIEFLFRYSAEREVTLQISVGPRVDVVLQAIAFSVLAGLAETFGGGFHRFRFRFEDEPRRRIERPLIRRRQRIVAAPEGVDRAGEKHGAATG